MKTKLTFLKQRMKQTTMLFSFLLTLLCSANVLHAQCSLACNGSTQVSLDISCQAMITPEMILNDQATSCAGGVFEVTVMDAQGVAILTSPMVGSSEVGQTLTVKVTDTASGNSCWGDIVVEDKIAPTIDCAAAQTAIDAAPFFCYDLFAFDIAPFVTENCGIDTIILSSELVTANDCSGALAADILKIIEREYIVIDASGNQSTTCMLTFTVNRVPGPPFSNIVCPAPLLESSNNALLCNGVYATDANGHPAPSVTGVPQLDQDGVLVGTVPNPNFVDNEGPDGIDDNDPAILTGDPAFVDLKGTPGADGNDDNGVDTVPADADRIDLFPAPMIYCNLLSAYTDVELPAIGCVTKIIRTWSIIEWNCDARDIPNCVQMIEIVDNEAPTFTAPVDQTVTTNVNGNYSSGAHGAVSCAASVNLPAIVAVDNCNNDPITVDVTYTDGFLDNQNGGLVELPLGVNTITYTVYDGCYNSSSASYTITVVDNTAPVAICIQNTVVGLTNNGQNGSSTAVYAESFDSGSYDDCKLDKVLVRRMDNGVPCGDNITDFNPSVSFCCADIGTDVMVVFRAYDVNGNFNDCMVSVEVQDKLAPVITCPSDMTVNCTAFYDTSNLSGAFGSATATDNCNVTMTETFESNLNQCNTGTITRRFVATDDGGRQDSCFQTITFMNPTPFGCTDVVDPIGSPDDITWPADVAAEGCFDPASTDFLPEVTGTPTFSDDQCDLVGANYTDQVFPFNNTNGDACFKIIREWKVIDWCQYGTQCNIAIGNTYATWTWTQVIKISNAVDPVITSSCDAKSTCTFDALCATGFIELTATATDDCTDVLTYTYDVDINNDGVADVDAAGNATYLPVTGAGNSLDASGDYPVGTHSVSYTFRDKCGNVATCTQVFTIQNCKAPTAYCLNGLATDLMPVDLDNDGTADWGMIDIWANDFDNGSSHPCGYEVVFSFSQDTSNTSIIFDCNTTGQQTVDVYATAIDGNGDIVSFSFCTTFISIQDNMNVCPTTGGPTGGRIAGRIATENNETLEDVAIQLEGAALNTANTDASGEYAFPEMNLGGSYVVDPSKNTDPMNGVSTLDLVIVQRHILGIDNLDSPYKHIAADINNDANISAIDLVELRKLILGVNMEFNSNESWRFVDAAYTFDSNEDPLENELPESYTIETLDNDMNVDFTAIKVGDVNNTVVTNLVGQSIDNRYSETLSFDINNQEFAAGDIVEVPFYATQNVDILGYQFTLDFDASNLEFVDGKSGEILTNTYNYGTQLADKGLVTTSWNTVTPELINKGKIAFTLVFKAKAAGSLASDLQVNSQLTSAEAYNADQELMNVEVRFDNDEANEGLGYVLYQNTPNPFDNSTEISFHLPKAMNAQLRIYDVSGKTIKVYNEVYQAGMNMIVVDKSTLAAAGILYYTLETDNFTATKRMVVIK